MLRNAGYWLLRLANPPIFSVRLLAGSARLSKGVAPPGLVQDFAAVAEEFGIEDGYVDCVHSNNGPRLRFSPGVASASHQRFRNLLGAYRNRR